MKNFLKACMTGILPRSIFTGSPVLVADMTWSCIQVMNDISGLPTVSSSFLSPVSAVNPVERHMPSSYLPSFPGSLFSSAFRRRIISATFPAADWTTRSLPFCDLDMDMKRRGNLIEFYIFYLDTIDIEDRF